MCEWYIGIVHILNLSPASLCVSDILVSSIYWTFHTCFTQYVWVIYWYRPYIEPFSCFIMCEWYIGIVHILNLSPASLMCEWYIGIVHILNLSNTPASLMCEWYIGIVHILNLSPASLCVSDILVSSIYWTFLLLHYVWVIYWYRPYIEPFSCFLMCEWYIGIVHILNLSPPASFLLLHYVWVIYWYRPYIEPFSCFIMCEWYIGIVHILNLSPASLCVSDILVSSIYWTFLLLHYVWVIYWYRPYIEPFSCFLMCEWYIGIVHILNLSPASLCVSDILVSSIYLPYIYQLVLLFVCVCSVVCVRSFDYFLWNVLYLRDCLGGLAHFYSEMNFALSLYVTYVSPLTGTFAL